MQRFGSMAPGGSTFSGPDHIDSLPTDKSQLNVGEVQLMDVLFKENKTDMQKFLEGSKEVLLAGLLFTLFSLPQIDPFIIQFFPSAGTSPFILIGAKAFVFMVLFFVVKNFYLVRA